MSSSALQVRAINRCHPERSIRGLCECGSKDPYPGPKPSPFVVPPTCHRRSFRITRSTCASAKPDAPLKYYSCAKPLSPAIPFQSSQIALRIVRFALSDWLLYSYQLRETEPTLPVSENCPAQRHSVESSTTFSTATTVAPVGTPKTFCSQLFRDSGRAFLQGDEG
jgi:hypothetical protein